MADVVELIRLGAGDYARAHRAAREAAALVTGAISRQSWDHVLDAVDAADRDLAKLDDARLEPLAARLDMVARAGDPARQRRMLATEAGPAIRGACRRYGPRHELMHRMRAAREIAIRSVGVADAKGRRAGDRVAKAIHRHGLNSAKAIRAELRGIDVLRDLPLPELVATRNRELVDRLPADERRSRIASDLSTTCFELARWRPRCTVSRCSTPAKPRGWPR